MTIKDFEASKAQGVHSRFPAFAGDWQGTVRVWFQPGEPSDVAHVDGSLRLILDGRFILHEYTSTFMGNPQQGVALYGYHLDRQRYEVAWVDSGHNGTSIMYCESGQTAGPLNVLGRYGGHDGQTPWGWRTTLELPEANRLLITMYNIPPQGEEAKAVEFDYTRR